MSRKKKKLIITAAVLCVVLVIGFIGMRLMMKVGSIKYIYNYMHDTEGSIPAEQYELTPSPGVYGSNGLRNHSVPGTDAASFGLHTMGEVNGELAKGYLREEEIVFSEEYSQNLNNANGLYTFRGNYLRNVSSYGRPKIAEKKISSESWTYKTGKVLKSDGVDYWSGNGWTGQPITVKWDKETKNIMNLYDNAKEKDGLVEVIYPGMDGWIHFLDIDDGTETRPAINVGMTFKGTASLYPGGVPILFCGSGDAQTGVYGENVCQRFYIYSLIDGTLLYEGGMNDDFAPRIWHAYDSSPIIHAESDTLFYPGENGVIYSMKLNTRYDRAKGTVSVDPSNVVKFRIDADRYSEGGLLWGSESSAVACGEYLYLGDNSGLIYCLDINSNELVWANDLKEDINSSPMMEIAENGEKYLYFATTLKYGYNEHYMGEAAIYKVYAKTGEIMWKKPYEVHTVKGLAGGVLSTGVIGEGKISDMVIYSVSKTPGVESGYIVALNKETGDEIWRCELPAYSWSSTVCVYADDGSPYLLQGCSDGRLLLLDAVTGEILDSQNYGSNIEATPVVYGNRVVLATRSEKIIGTSIE